MELLKKAELDLFLTQDHAMHVTPGVGSHLGMGSYSVGSHYVYIHTMYTSLNSRHFISSNSKVS